MWASRVAAAALVLAVLAVAFPARAGNGARLMRLVPDEAGFVGVVDLARVRRTPLFRAGSSQLLAAPHVDKMIAAGIDPLADVDTLLIAGAASAVTGEGETFRLVVLEGRFSPLTPEKLFASGGQVMTRGKIRYWTDGSVAAALVGKRLIVADADRIERAIDAAIGTRPGSARSRKLAALRSAITATDTRHHAWLVAILPESLRVQARSAGAPLEALAIAATSTADLHLEVRGMVRDAEAANATAELIRGNLTGLAQVLSSAGMSSLADSLTVDADAATVRLTGSVRGGEIDTVIGLVGAVIAR
jgi:hypothetical protein